MKRYSSANLVKQEELQSLAKEKIPKEHFLVMGPFFIFIILFHYILRNLIKLCLLVIALSIYLRHDANSIRLPLSSDL